MTTAPKKSNNKSRKKTKLKRQGSGKQYRILFESNPQPMWVYDLVTLSFLTVNDAAIYHYGYSREEFLSMTIKDIRPPEDVSALLDNVSKVTSGLDAAGIWRHRKKDGSIIFVEITSHTMTFKGRKAEVVLANNVTERRRTEERMAKLTECFLGFGTDPLENINRLTAVCGELMGAATALYNRLDGGMLRTLGQWNIPPDFKTVDKPEGHICHDMISQRKDEVLVIHNLHETVYAHTDPNVKAYGLKTYIGKAVKFGNEYVGSLCAVYKEDFVPGESDLRLMRIIASAIGTEENRRGAKEELKQSEEKYRLLIESIQDGIFIIQDGKIQYANEALARIGGYKVSELIGKNFIDIIAPEDRELTKDKHIRRLSGENVPRDYEVRVLTRDGKTRRIVNLNIGIFNYQGRMATMGTVKDITEKRMAEEALCESEALFRATFEQAAIGMVRVDLTGRTVETNAAFRNMLGYSGKELQAMVFTEYTHPDDAGLDMELFKELVAGKNNTFQIKKRYVRKNGSMFWGRLTASLVRDPEGEPQFAIGMVEDITERKEAEEKLQRSEEKYRTLIENIQDALFIIQDFKIEFANEAFARMAGYAEEEEVIGKDFREFIAPEDLGMVVDYYRRRQKGETVPKEYEFNAVHKNGKTRVTVNINVGLMNYRGRVAIIGTLKDITERKRAEEMQKEKARAELYGFMVSALPVFASGVPPSVRNILVCNFAERFEKNIMPRFKEEMKSPNLKQKGHLDAFMQWLSGLFTNFGIRNKIIPDGTKRRLELLNCPWTGEARGNPIFCLICRSIVIRSFTWMSLKGTPVQNSSIASGSMSCTFDINV